MNFVTAAQYSKSNLAHFNINRRAATDFLRINSSLGRRSRAEHCTLIGQDPS